MRDYATITGHFWVQGLGNTLKRDPNARTLALYLMSAPTSEMSGVYNVSVHTMAGDLGMTELEVRHALDTLTAHEFCFYDPSANLIWVVDFAREQLAEKLELLDKRRTGFMHALEGRRPPHYFTRLCADHYREAYQLGDWMPPLATKRRSLTETVMAAAQADRQARAAKPAGIPLRCQDQDQDQDQEQDQDQKQEQDLRTPPPLAVGGGAGGKLAKPSSPPRPDGLPPTTAAVVEEYSSDLKRPGYLLSELERRAKEQMRQRMSEAVLRKREHDASKDAGDADAQDAGTPSPPLGAPPPPPAGPDDASPPRAGALPIAPADPWGLLPPPEKKKRGPKPKTPSRLDPDWRPSQATIDRFKREHVDCLGSLERFVNYFCSRPGKDGIKLDWERTFTNWILEDIDRGRAHPYEPPPPPEPEPEPYEVYKPSEEEIQALFAKMDEAAKPKTYDVSETAYQEAASS